MPGTTITLNIHLTTKQDPDFYFRTIDDFLAVYINNDISLFFRDPERIDKFVKVLLEGKLELMKALEKKALEVVE